MNVRHAPRHVSRLVALTLGSALALSVACSSTTEQQPGSSTDETDPAPAKPPGEKGTAKPAPAPVEQESPKTGDEACAVKGTAQACQTCCAQGHQKGYQTYFGALLACACTGAGGDAGAAGACAAECKDTVCKATPSNPDAACNACLSEVLADQSAACTAPLTSACQADTDCVALLGCAQGCPQN
jgi:hypothetical protein